MSENNGQKQNDSSSVTVSRSTVKGIIIAANVLVIGLIIAVVALATGKDNDDKLKTDSTPSKAVTTASSESKKEDESSESTDEDSEETSSADDTSSEAESKAKSKSDSKSESKSDKDEDEGEGFILYYSGDNSWQDGDAVMTGMSISVKNNSGKAVSDWKLELEIEGLKKCDGWCGTYTCSGDTLTITPAEFNSEIAAGATLGDLGCNIGTSVALNVKSAKLSGTECTIKKGSTPKSTQQSGGNNNNNGGDQNASVNVDELLKRSPKAKQGDDWLHTDGNRILDKDGKEVWLTGCNWFGYNTGTNVFDGLWNSVLTESVDAIADHGFNLIRVPFSAELINNWADGNYPQANYNNAYNTELNSMNSLQIFDYFLKLAEENGLKVMIDIHSANTDAAGHNANLWYTDKVSVKEYYAALEWMADRYKDNDTIIAFDLKNEPHGKPNEGDAAAKWDDSKDANNWKYVAETAAGKVLKKNPNVLIMVEGTETYPKKKGNYKSTDNEDYYFNWWGGNLRGVKDYPIDLGKHQDKLVYSPHDYGPTVYQQPWFEGSYDYDSLMKDCWKDNWFYIYEKKTAPLLIGEWGGFMTEPNITWMTHMRTLIKKYNLHHTFWCFNANSGDTGGLVLDDFKTWDDEKYNFVKEVLWQEDGKFVGLDHAIPLGDNGITLKKAKGLK
ncbi:Aryl-phospho-beta-D-glucosidase BglC, GH1 family [Ruminococcus sp. YE71]|uniref:cellulase family glycosylhydrolase n=1 Tax=unclassified Ruminococcus TaxID=2608920 RepID=UPI00088DEBFB|nr:MULTISPECIES: cellulase family glycosylhydrolase [unclassified Ruminococcus]SDA11846.1 Aryl-phospho-beta-D-glucosidase BglC, GH1 family [Ruminococcus sp. YE78]SFW15845.1 Aryl-phospho-beta-D-glucosidase BglC, GH1 family [Ruminococcus sp. YE71]